MYLPSSMSARRTDPDLFRQILKLIGRVIGVVHMVMTPASLICRAWRQAPLAAPALRRRSVGLLPAAGKCQHEQCQGQCKISFHR
jgi:hypothetical protein